MADTLPNVTLPPNIWVDLYAATGVPVGTAIGVSNIGVADVYLTVAPSEHATPYHNLPAQISPFIGRETELVELSDLLADPAIRLVTIYGAGGMGKPRMEIMFSSAQL